MAMCHATTTSRVCPCAYFAKQTTIKQEIVTQLYSSSGLESWSGSSQHQNGSFKDSEFDHQDGLAADTTEHYAVSIR